MKKLVVPAALLAFGCASHSSQMNAKTPGRQPAPQTVDGSKGSLNLAVPAGVPASTATVEVVLLGLSIAVPGTDALSCTAVPNDGSDLAVILNMIARQTGARCMSQATATPYSPGINVGAQSLIPGEYVAAVVLLDGGNHALQYGAGVVNVTAGTTTPVAIAMQNYVQGSGNIDITIVEPGATEPTQPVVTSTASACPALPDNLKPVYEFLTNDAHRFYYDTSVQGGLAKGYALNANSYPNGVVFTALSAPEGGCTEAFQRCFDPSSGNTWIEHLENACDGFQQDSPALFYACPTPTTSCSDGVPVVRLRWDGVAHQMTTRQADVNLCANSPGCLNQTIQFYLPVQ